MLRRIEDVFRRDAPLAYGVILALTGIADGLWQGAYAWFLSAKLGFTAPEIAVVIGSQFILQIIFEVPSGTIADKGTTRSVLLGAYLAFFCYCMIYAGAGSSLLGLAGNSKPVLLLLAVLAEACFGIGTALLSGTLDAWIAERERAASKERAEDFARRLRKVHSISELWGQAPSAIVGTGAFMLATEGHHEWPWILGGLCYLVTGIVVLVAMAPAAQQESRMASQTLAMHVGRFTSRALSYLQEKPDTFRLFVRSALAHMPFYATQVFWIPFLAQTCFVGQADVLGVGSPAHGGIPLLATLWGAGELARALGGSLFAEVPFRGGHRDDRRRRIRHASVGMFGYGAGVSLQLLAVLLDYKEVELFAMGYLMARLFEGRVRRDLSIVTDQSIVSDRATLRSLDSLIKALFGLVYITLIGALMYADPVIGYVAIGATAMLAGVQFLFLARERQFTAGAGVRRSHWRNVNVLTLAFVAVLLVVLVGVGTRSRPLWAQLNDWSSTGDVVQMAQVELRTTKEAVDLRPSELWTWDLTKRGHHGVGCRVPVDSPMELWNNDITSNQDVRATLRSIGGGYYLEFMLPHDGSGDDPEPLRVKLSTRASRYIQCFRLRDQPASFEIPFDERGVIPVSAKALNAPASSSLMVYAELVVGILVVFVLIGLAGADVRRRLQEVLQTIPGTLLDEARQATGTGPEYIRAFSEGLPTECFRPFEDFLANLGASYLVLGGYAAEGRNILECPIHVYGALSKDVVPGAPATVDAQADRLRHWLTLPETHANKTDSTSRRYAHDGEATATYAAASVVLRVAPKCQTGRRKDTVLGGFAIAFFARDQAPRYISPVERKVLQLLAELSRMQLDRAHRNVDVQDTLHWAKTIMDTIRLPLREATRTNVFDLALIASCASRATLGHARLSEKLGVAGNSGPPVPLRDGLQGVAALFSRSAEGTMSVSLELPAVDELVTHAAWVLIEGALIELLWNAAKYGCSADHPDVNATLRVQSGDVHVFTVTNDLPLDRDARQTRGIGLITTPRRVAECGGVFFPLATIDGQTEVGFSLPRSFVESAYETGSNPRR